MIESFGETGSLRDVGIADNILAPDPLDFLAGRSEMAAHIRSYPWSDHPLGSPAAWPQSLKTILRFMLDSRYSMWMGWGKNLTFFYNDAYARDTLSKKHPWALGRPASEVWSEIWSEIGPRIEHVIGNGEATWDEGLLLILERSGFPEETYHTFSYSPLYDDDNRPAGMFCVVTEETERILNARWTRTLRDLAAALTSAKTESDFVSAVDHVLESNDRDLPFAQIYLADEAGKSVRPILSDSVESGRWPLWPIDDVLARGESMLVEGLHAMNVNLPTGAWETSPESVRLMPMSRRSFHSPIGVFLAGLNPYRPLDSGYQGFLDLFVGQLDGAIANIRTLEEERKRVEVLAELDRAKTVFFSNVSHELRTPLTLMLGPLQDALSGAHGDLPARMAEDLGVAHRNTLRLLKLVNTLLDFSRVEAGRMTAVYEETDLAALTADLSASFRSAAERTGLELVVDCEPLTDMVFVDRSLWEKIVLNLLSNAFKYTFDGQVRVSLRREAGSALLTVADTGIGISAEDLPRIFDRFYRAEGVRGRTHEGTGIGLSLVAELVKIHGGTVAAESVLGVGSVFTVSIPADRRDFPGGPSMYEPPVNRTARQSNPLVEETLGWVAEDAPSHDPGATEGEELRGTVVVADDNPDMRGYIVRLLSPRYRVIPVGNGEEALEAIRQEKPDLLLTDVMMPLLDGFGLLRKIRETPEISGLPIIMVSARAGEDAKVEGLQRGADDYLIKPFSARELMARVDAQIDLSRVRAEVLVELRRNEGRLEELVRERTADLLKTNEQLQGFTYSVSHDLRQQIRGISTNASILKLDASSQLDEENLLVLDRLVGSATRLSKLVDELLAYARLGKQEPIRESLNFSAMVGEVAAQLDRIRNSAVPIELRVNDGLNAVADASMLRIVIENLLDNAAKYSVNNPSPVIEFGKDGDAFFVRDNGIGFDTRYSGRLFQPFERLHTEKEFSGSGIGLANVKRIIEKHGGKVWADSNLGSGSTFYFTLPEGG